MAGKKKKPKKVEYTKELMDWKDALDEAGHKVGDFLRPAEKWEANPQDTAALQEARKAQPKALEAVEAARKKLDLFKAAFAKFQKQNAAAIKKNDKLRSLIDTTDALVKDQEKQLSTMEAWTKNFKLPKE